MLLKCTVCEHKFFYFRIPGKLGGTPPNICGHRENNGKWISNQFCYRARNQRYTQIERAKRIANKGYNRYIYRNTPGPKVKNRCVNIILDYDTGKRHMCNKVTGNNGTNYYYCQQCWDRKQEVSSAEYPESIYDRECKVADLQGVPGIGKVRKGGPPAR